MASALGVLKWPPDAVWGSTMYEFTLAMKGHLLSQGVSTDGPLSRNEYLAMKREDEKRKRGT